MDLCDTPSPGRACVAELSVFGWPIEGFENISINTDYIELSVVFVWSGDVSSKHAVSPLSPRSTLCARWPVFTPEIRFPTRSLARPVIVIASQRWPGLAKHRPGSVARSGDTGASIQAPEIGWLGVTVSLPLIWRSVLCWVTINNISLQSKLIFT